MADHSCSRCGGPRGPRLSGLCSWCHKLASHCWICGTDRDAGNGACDACRELFRTKLGPLYDDERRSAMSQPKRFDVIEHRDALQRIANAYRTYSQKRRALEDQNLSPNARARELAKLEEQSRHRRDPLPSWARDEIMKLRAESAKHRVQAKEAHSKLRRDEALDVVAQAVAELGMDPLLTFAVLNTDQVLAELEPDEPDFGEQVRNRLTALLTDEPRLAMPPVSKLSKLQKSGVKAVRR